MAESADRKMKNTVRNEAIKRLIAAHPEEWGRLLGEEWERLRPGKPPQQGKKAVLPVDQMIKEYQAGASIETLAKKYGVARSTVQSRLPKEIMRPPGVRKGERPRGLRQFYET